MGSVRRWVALLLSRSLCISLTIAPAFVSATELGTNAAFLLRTHSSPRSQCNKSKLPAERSDRDGERKGDGVLQPITGFHTDNEDHWVARLACGHFQHVRHNPPMSERPWVLSKEGRKSFLGYKLICKKCAAGAPKDVR
mmetsp:Transcript_27698/g.81387  ORF Transcript_27698/g.81387 Transcript_27698/m.81387 type:complete len:139 (-) Transcript_27698:193-609(-)